MNIKSENPLIFFAKTENQMLKNGKSANHKEHQNQENRSFLAQKQKNRSKKLAKTAKPKIPMPLSLIMAQIWIMQKKFCSKGVGATVMI